MSAGATGAGSTLPARRERSGLALARVGAALYVVWGIMHLGAAAQVWMLARDIDGVVGGRLQQNAWHLALLATFAILVALIGNRRNDRTAFWANAFVIGATDIGFVLLLLGPGLIPPLPGAIGPAVWLAALIVSALAMRRRASA